MGTEPRIHDLEAVFNEKAPKSQLDRIRKKNIIRVAIVEKKAYWVHQNVFYVADVVNGYIDNDGATAIDAYKLSEKEMKNLLDVLDQLG